MQIKLLVDVSGMRNGLDWPPRGSVVDLPEDEAQSMIRAGMAVQTNERMTAVIEAAVTDSAPEVAVVPSTPGLTTKTGPTRRAPAKGK